MSYTIRNIQPSVLFVPDAGLRLESGQTAVVDMLTPQMQSLLTLRALEVVMPEGPPAAPVVTPPAPDGPPPPVSAAAMPVPEQAPAAPTTSEPASAEFPPAKAPTDSRAAMPPVEEKRGGRKAAAHAVRVEERDDAQ